jgi:hypothetical protein
LHWCSSPLPRCSPKIVSLDGKIEPNESFRKINFAFKAHLNYLNDPKYLTQKLNPTTNVIPEKYPKTKFLKFPNLSKSWP